MRTPVAASKALTVPVVSTANTMPAPITGAAASRRRLLLPAICAVQARTGAAPSETWPGDFAALPPGLRPFGIGARSGHHHLQAGEARIDLDRGCDAGEDRRAIAHGRRLGSAVTATEQAASSERQQQRPQGPPGEVCAPRRPGPGCRISKAA